MAIAKILATYSSFGDNAITDTDSDTFSNLGGIGSYHDGEIYNFDFSQIPNNATINSITLKIKGCGFYGSSVKSNYTYNGKTYSFWSTSYSGQELTGIFYNGSNSLVNITVPAGTNDSISAPEGATVQSYSIPITEYNSMKNNNSSNTLRFYAAFSGSYGSTSRSGYIMCVYGIELDIDYTVLSGKVKVNNIWKNISAAYVKVNNNWKNINSILMKANGNWYSAGGSGGGGISIEIVSWADGTDEQVAAMIAAAQRGQIDLQQDGGWAVGDIRSITVGAFTDAFGNSHSQQNCDIVITSFDEYESNGNVLQFDFKNGLSTKTKMNDSDVNTYKTSKMYTTLNTLADALPTWLKNSMLIFSMKSNVNGNASSAETLTNIKLALRSVKEVGLGNSGIYAYEGSVIAYYTSSTRQKGDGWWLRSPYTGSTTDYCRVKSGGALGNYKAYNATYTQRIAPFGLL